MDASVNMKMTPDEHRLIRDCLRQAKQQSDLIFEMGQSESGATPKERQTARERSARIADLLAKI